MGKWGHRNMVSGRIEILKKYRPGTIELGSTASGRPAASIPVSFRRNPWLRKPDCARHVIAHVSCSESHIVSCFICFHTVHRMSRLQTYLCLWTVQAAMPKVFARHQRAGSQRTVFQVVVLVQIVHRNCKTSADNLAASRVLEHGAIQTKSHQANQRSEIALSVWAPYSGTLYGGDTMAERAFLPTPLVVEAKTHYLREIEGTRRRSFKMQQCNYWTALRSSKDRTRTLECKVG